MKKILIYGDSNTWGDNFITGVRIPDEKQWVNILQNKLGSDYILLQEGLPGRLAGDEEKEKPFKNGKDSFISIYRTNAPVDTLVISLGTNDLQTKYQKNSKKIIDDIIWYKKVLEELFLDEDDKKKYFNNKMPNIYFILPANFDYIDKASVVFDNESENKRQDIIKYFDDSSLNHIVFNDLKLFDDGLHYNYEDNEQVAERMYEVLKNE